MGKDFETMWVYRKDQDTYELIKAHRFNPEFHRRLFWKNLLTFGVKRVKNIEIDWKNPWLVGIGTAMFTFVLYLLFPAR